MKNEILEKVSPQLEEMAKFMKFGRKKLKDEITCSLIDFHGVHLSLGEERNKYRKHAKELASAKVALEKENLNVKNKLHQREEDLVGLESEHGLLKAEHELTCKNVQALESVKAALENENLDVKGRLYQREESLAYLEKENLDVKGRLYQREESLASLESEHSLLETKHDFISNILSANPEINENLKKFRKMLNNDFMDFANDESSLAEEAEAIMILKGVEQELELIASFPDIYNKNIIAIGGGFSSGKSAFVNSFFQESNIKLPIGIEPVTAIPTYIISGSSDVVKGYSKNGGAVDIDVDLYGKLSHNFVKSFKFNLKDIMPFMAIETRINNIENICFIDTPGYNPSVTDGFTSEDEKTAAEYLEQAHALIWMIGLDSVGAIPASDIKFLEELDLDNKRLYVIANKADLRSVDDLEDILDEIKESLNDYDIEFAGISAFSANKKKEYSYRGIPLQEFLAEENTKIESKKRVFSEIEKVFGMYSCAINKDIENAKGMKSKFNSLELDILQSGYDLDETDFSARLEEMKNSFSTQKLESQLEEMKRIKITMIAVVNDIFANF